MTDYLFDTDALIELLRGRNANIRSRVARHVARIQFSTVSLSELEYGVLRSPSQANNRIAVSELMQVSTTHPVTDEVARAAAGIRHELSVTGRAIGPFDLLIAATAVVHGLTLVTGNEREFVRVPGLSTVNWLR
jgi:tRNA(fMet)-specific endonuclease VapC